MNDDELIQGMRRVGLAGPPPGFASRPPAPNPHQQAHQSEGLDLDEAQLSSIFRLALDDDGVFRPQQQAQPHPQQNYLPQQTSFAVPQPVAGGFQQGPPPGQRQPQQPPMSPGVMSAPGPMQGVHSPMMRPMPGAQQFMAPPPPPQMFSPMAPPPPMMSPQPRQDSGRERFKDYARMKGREIANIVRSQLRTVETGDDFADDFYFYQAEERKKQRAAAAALHPQHRMPSGGSLDDFSNDERPAELLKMLKAIQNRSSSAAAPIIIHAPAGPLPELPGSKTAQQEAMERRAQKSAEAASKWAGEKNVLGRMTKGNLRTPRELIALRDSILEGGANSSGNDSFSGPGWKLRRIAIDVSDCLGEITDLNRHLKARAAALPQGGGPLLQGWEPVYEKVRELESQQLAACERLAKLMGLTDGDDGQLLSLLWLPKGRRTAVRAIKSLLNEHLVLLLEAAARILVYFVCTSPDGKNSPDANARELYEIDILAANALAKEYSQLGLQQAAKCLKLFLGSQTPESLRAVIATPGGALVSKALLLNGQERSESCTDAELKATWEEAFQAFINMAEEGISAKQRS